MIVRRGGPISKEIKKKDEKIKYHDLKLSYNYGTEENPIIDDFYFEGSVVTSRGIKSKSEPAVGKHGPYTKTTLSMPSALAFLICLNL